MKLSKAFDNVNASKSDPNRQFLCHVTYTVQTEQQADESTTRTAKELMEIDLHDRNKFNSII